MLKVKKGGQDKKEINDHVTSSSLSTSRSLLGITLVLFFASSVSWCRLLLLHGYILIEREVKAACIPSLLPLSSLVTLHVIKDSN